MARRPSQRTTAAGAEPAARAPQPRRRRAPARPRASSAASSLAAGAGTFGQGARLAGSAATRGARGVAAGVAWAAAGLARAARRVSAVPEVRRLAALAVLAGAVAGASHAVRQRVEAWPQFALGAAQLQCPAPPAGLSEAARRDVARLPLPVEAHAFDRRLVPFLAASLRELPWVEAVDEVRLEAPARLRFRVRTRRPIARVGDALLTHDGALIPASYGAQPALLPLLSGVPAASRALARQRALAAAVRVLEDLGPLAARVEAIDVGNLGGAQDPLASEVTLTLVGGTSVAWGRAGTSERPHRAGAVKRAELEAFLAAFPDLARVEQVSLRWDQTTYVLRAAPAVAAR